MARNVGDLALLLSVHGRPRPARAAGARRPGRRPSRRRWPARSPGCGSRCRSTSAAPSRSTHEVAAVVEAPAAGLRGAGARGRRGAPRPAAGRRHLPHAAGLALPGRASATLLAEHPDVVQAVAGRQHPRRASADRRRRRPRLRAAHRARRRRMRAFFDVYDVLVLPVSQVPPFPADQEFPDRRSTARPMATTSTGCGRRTSSPSPAARRSRCRPAAPPTACRSASSSSRRTAPTAAARGRGGLRARRCRPVRMAVDLAQARRPDAVG